MGMPMAKTVLLAWDPQPYTPQRDLGPIVGSELGSHTGLNVSPCFAPSCVGTSVTLSASNWRQATAQVALSPKPCSRGAFWYLLRVL